MSSRLARVLGLLATILTASCGPPPPVGYNNIPQCRFDPGCAGGMGALCQTDADCASSFCCDDDANCNGGMCTAPCDKNVDCPANMLCEHHVCFFSCDGDADCADGMSCEHNQRVCEWP